MCIVVFLSPPGEDSSSDLSSDSPVWSEDESDAELDLNVPLSEQGVETVTHGSEIVRCICEAQEENDFMIQVSFHPLKSDQTSILWFYFLMFLEEFLPHFP